MYLKSYVAFLAVSLFAINAFACSCRTLPLAMWVSTADHIFIGRIVAAYEFKSGVHVNYQLIETLKGNQNLVKYLETWLVHDDGSCGMSLSIGETYIFFTNSSGTVFICGGATEYFAGNEKHKAFLKQLRKLTTNAIKP